MLEKYYLEGCWCKAVGVGVGQVGLFDGKPWHGVGLGW